MEAVGIVALTVVVIAVSVTLAARGRKRWQAAVGLAAHELGLEVRPGGVWSLASADGTVSGLGVEIDTFTTSTGKSSTTHSRIVVQTGLPHSFLLESEGLIGSFKKAFGGQDIQLGVPQVDAALLIRASDEADIISRFHYDARRLVDEVFAGKAVQLKHGQLTFTKVGLIKSADELTRTTRRLLSFARSLGDRGTDTPGRLADNAIHDRYAPFRRRCLELLLSRYPSRSEAKDAARGGLSDREPSLRLLAATALGGPDAVGVLAELARDRYLPEPMRTEAVIALGQNLAPAAGEALLELLPGAPAGLLPAVLQAFAKRRMRPPFAALEAHLGAREPAARQALARALGDSDEPRASTLLADMLDPDQPEVSIAAARALTRVGDIHAVEPLLPLTKGVFAKRELKEAAREAVAAIQGRLGDADGGRLSLAQDEGGGLALATEEGSLSKVREEGPADSA